MSWYEPPPAQARVLFVCTGNTCRSPYAEHMLREQLHRRGVDDIAIDSAGTAARSGGTAAPRILAALAERGIDAGVFRTKPVSPELVQAADLILTAETAHRAVVTRLDPRALGRVFTLRQFARLLPMAAPPSTPTVADLIFSCSQARGMGPLVGEDDDDLPDPWNRSRFVYRRAMRATDVALDRIVAALSPARR